MSITTAAASASSASYGLMQAQGPQKPRTETGAEASASEKAASKPVAQDGKGRFVDIAV